MASAVIGALRVNLGIDTAQFSEGLTGVRASLASAGRSLQSWGGKLSTFVTAPIAAAGAAVTAAVTGIAKDVEQLQKAAQVSNAGFEEFQRLAFAARSVGVEGDKLADIFKDVNDRVGEFNQTGGGPMADFFKNIAPRVGLTAEAFRNLSGPQALQLYYDSLVKAGASQQELTFYLEAMASDATALIPLLANAGQGFRDLGESAAVVSEEEAAGLKAYNDSMRALGAAIQQLTIAVATSGILDFVTQIALKLAEWVNVLAETNPEILKWGTLIAGLAAALGPVVVSLGLMATAIAAIGLPITAVIAGITALTVAVVAFWPEIQAAWEWVKKLFEIFVQLHTQVINAVIQKFQELGAAIVSSLAGIGREIIGVFKALPGQMIQIGQDIISGLWQGIKNKWEELKGGVADIASGIKDSFTGFFDIHSPSRVMEEIGVNIIQGLGNGMASSKGMAVTAAQDVAGGVKVAFNGIENVGAGVGEGIGGAFDGVGSSIAEAIKGTKTWRDVALDALRSIASSLLSTMDFGSGFGGGLLKGLLGGLVGFQNGGSFMVGGSGGIDSQLVAFKASPNERVSVTKPGQRMDGSTYAPTYNIDARGADQAAIVRLERGLAERDRTEAKRVAGFEHTRSTRNTRP
ncbi:hypothetical protein I7G59_09670 [Sinorhizobium meliloti]|uniref:phage tail protein n=1 Tax=Rhizobium meliloti TaxID=382 RepID=UPI0023806A5D|nr:hypothetical protein [Sinorhizobium meliloti]MDE3797594.1 hypothetical protein [Sinorhizobium meliloti]